MKTILTDLDTLYSAHGSWDAVAAAVGVTSRTVRNWRSGAILPPISMVRLVSHEAACVTLNKTCLDIVGQADTEARAAVTEVL